MALSNPRPIFGIHSFTGYRRSDRTYYGILRVLGSSTFNLTGELINLNGGSQKYPWAVEEGTVEASIELVVREYPSWLMEVLLGKAPTDNAAEASGSVSAIANANGTSAVDATTGIASVTATAADEADLKFSKYVVKVTSATDVTVYASSNVDFARGTDSSYENDDLEILAADITIPDTGGTVAIADYGLTFTGGSGSVAMTVGDTATFEVRPQNSASMDATFGGLSDTFPEFGAILVGKKLGDGRMFEVDVFRCKGAGLPFGFEENAFSEASVSINAFYDSDRNGVFSTRTVSPLSAS